MNVNSSAKASFISDLITAEISDFIVARMSDFKESTSASLGEGEGGAELLALAVAGSEVVSGLEAAELEYLYFLKPDATLLLFQARITQGSSPARSNAQNSKDI